jgi:hypothetical protein
MTPGEEARAVAYEQMAAWITAGITAPVAFEAIMGRHGQFATWGNIEDLLIDWWLRQALPLARRAA